MSYSLKDVLGGLLPEIEEKESLHRTDLVERPNEQIKLYSVANESIDAQKTQKDPTDDLEELVVGPEGIERVSELLSGYIIWCSDTQQMWYAHDKLCLDKNFIYREDLEIAEISNGMVDSETTVVKFFNDRAGFLSSKILTRKTCYILDIPGNETYEVYYDSAYPSIHYGKATPQGMFIHKYENRFHRDMAMIALDKFYSEQSGREAGEYTKKKFAQNEAVIITDGAWMKNTCSSAYYYIDNTSVIKMVEGVIPSEPDQAVLISEINAAYNALSMCIARKKTKIKYYYDNTSILNVFRNRKMEYVEEVKRYKELLETMSTTGFNVLFIELHPKTDEEKDTLNKALVFFHNSCDAECRLMSDVMKKDYKSFIDSDVKGVSYSEFKASVKPKGQPKNNGQRRPQQRR